MSRGSSWFVVEAGALVRGRMRREIERAAWETGLDVRVDESRGLMSSAYRFTVTGDSAKVAAFVRGVERWAEEIGGEAA